MWNWLARVLGQDPAGKTGRSGSAPPFQPEAGTLGRDEFAGSVPTTPTPAEPFEARAPEPFDIAPFPSTPSPASDTVGTELSDEAVANIPATHDATHAETTDDAGVIPQLSVAAFAVQSLAGGRVFARAEDGRLAHEPGNLAPTGRAVHGFVTDQHPGILFVMAADGPTAISGDRAAAHAFRIEESGEDAFALFDLGTDAYLCAPQFQDGVNPLENDRPSVNAWEMFHLVATEHETMPAALPPLLPPAGTPITAPVLHGWRS